MDKPDSMARAKPILGSKTIVSTTQPTNIGRYMRAPRAYDMPAETPPCWYRRNTLITKRTGRLAMKAADIPSPCLPT